MYYRSDWPELGLRRPLSAENSCPDSDNWQELGSNKWRWVSKPDDFESQLYGASVFNLHLEFLGSTKEWLTTRQVSAQVSRGLEEVLHGCLEHSPWPYAYVTAKVVQSEALFQVLIDAGFEPVEHRRLYSTSIDKKLKESGNTPGSAIRFQSLAAIAETHHDSIRGQILEMCTESFSSGFSRHFNDPFLLQRAPGLTYILNVMQRNFQRLPSHFIILALDGNSGQLCGFSMLSERSGVNSPYYTQLISAVGSIYRGQGVYAGLTRLLVENLPYESQLLNITHERNHAMQRAYENTGRLHKADTIVLRRVLGH